MESLPTEPRERENGDHQGDDDRYDWKSLHVEIFVLHRIAAWVAKVAKKPYVANAKKPLHAGEWHRAIAVATKEGVRFERTPVREGGILSRQPRQGRRAQCGGRLQVWFC